MSASSSSFISSPEPAAKMAEKPPSGSDDVSKIRLQDCFSSPISLRLKESLDECSNALASGDFDKSDAAVASVISLLDSAVESEDGATTPSEAAAAELLLEIHRYLTSSFSDQMVIDALSLELPKVVPKFAPLSDRCREIVGRIIDCLVSMCSPRDMLLILCEALDTHINISQAPISYIPLLIGLSKVFLCIQRHHVKQIKIALIIVLRVLKAIPLEVEDEYKDSLNDIYGAAINIANSIRATCEKMVDRSKDELCAILGLYVLENIALISRSRQSHVVSSCSSHIVQLSKFVPFCGLTYLGLITGCDSGAITSKVSQDVEDVDEFMASLSLTRDGAALTVVWGYISDEVAKAASEQFTVVLDNIQNNHIKRWQAVGMLRYSLSSIDNPWEIKSYCVELLLSMMDGSKSDDPNNEDISSFIPTLFAALQAIQRVMMGASDASLRKKAFDVLKKVVSDLPSSERFDMLKALITNSNSPSMTAILFDIVKEEILMENCHRSSPRNNESKQLQNRMMTSPFWSFDALELVELVLKPPRGGPPSLPEDTEPVLAALNLYRFILLIESAGKTNHTGVLSEKMLQKAYSDWLLPLRTLVSGIQAENEKDGGELAENILCGLNPVQLVLHRCIELVEEKLKHSK